MGFQPSVIVAGAGLAGLVATHELVKAGHRVLVLDQENRNNLGGQAFWSLGGLFLVNSPQQRRLGIKDSVELALQDWMGSAGFDRDADDHWARQWARAYVEFAATTKQPYLHELGIRFTPLVGWAERGDGTATGHGNSVPRFHLAWGTGPGVLKAFTGPVLEAERRGQVEFRFRHQCDELILEGTAVAGVRGTILAPTPLARGVASPREQVGEFELRAPAVVVATGGVGHNFELIRKYWPTARLGQYPDTMLAGVPQYVDGRMLAIAASAGANVVNPDRMWLYPEGMHNWNPVWPNHAIRIIPGPSSLWLDATGKRLAPPNFPGFSTLDTVRAIMGAGYDYSWFVLNQTIIEKEFMFSGSEQNPDITSGSRATVVRTRLAGGTPPPVKAFQDNGVDFVAAGSVAELVAGMNKLSRGPVISATKLEREIAARDREIGNKYTKDMQLMAIRNAREFIGDRLARAVKPHRLLDPAHGPLIAVRLNMLSRKSLGGLQTNLSSQVLRPDGTVLESLYAAGEAAGFGGGGMHGYNALEGTFLGGCIFSGRAAGLTLAKELR